MGRVQSLDNTYKAPGSTVLQTLVDLTLRSGRIKPVNLYMSIGMNKLRVPGLAILCKHKSSKKKHDIGNREYALVQMRRSLHSTHITSCPEKTICSTVDSFSCPV